MSRKEARELCMKILFEMSIQNNYDRKLVDYHLEESVTDNQKGYIDSLIGSTIDNLKEIDTTIDSYSKSWKIDRIAKVDLAILRLALAEILYLDEIPYAVSINEAVELAKKYSSNESDSYINGILGKYAEAMGLKNNEV
ncbi:transcription antitermination factor NusB [Alkaliphilus peptidifermentans]|uniref:Transcription antitermination protein NusB n=1 Tax=Alkaliphilus peptidifermentans DSM 18978 TaxID=1120976 RepID=A0A1G5KDM7_9FIRM|nr:transcription antitermination factor NusB [Alkaliphilus peptidifermentans]SCY98676.1 NusB antitermination factor [Alkaliphilus peptidifermentans DSM 18978]